VPIWTNKDNLPSYMCRAVEAMADNHDIGDADISITEVLDEPLVRHLKRKYGDTVKVDYSHRLLMLDGAMMDRLVFEYAPANAITHYRDEIEINGWKVSGELDILEPDKENPEHLILSDCKRSARGLGKKERRVYDYTAQVNGYLEILRRNRPELASRVTKLRILNWCRAWNVMRKEPSIEWIKVPIWSSERITELLTERVKYHQEWDGSETAPPKCDEHHRWVDPEKWACMKKGRKSALKLHDNEPEAEAHADTVDGGYVEYREENSIRCNYYCEYGMDSKCPHHGAGWLMA